MRQPIAFGKYLLLERISVGGMAEVFKAKYFGEEGFEKILAIKRILPSMVEDEEFIRMFIDEAKIAGQLSHPNIGQIFELGKIDTSHFIAMEYVWGKDVLQIHNRFRRLRQKMPLSMGAFIASRVCEGLDYAHRKTDEQEKPLHIVHRDVSPQNILVSFAGEIKMIDFGIAKARSRSSKTQAGVLKGKFGYMSPEQVRGLPLDQRSDIFAIGTLLFEMATGERLFIGETDFATLEKVRNADVPRPAKVNPAIVPEFETIILKALKRNPEERYQWASEMQEDLQTFLMSQKPIFTSKNLSSSLTQMFEAERNREQNVLEEYRKIRREDLDSLPKQSAGRREVAVSQLSLPTTTDLAESLADAASEDEQGGKTQVGGLPTFMFAEGDDGPTLSADDIQEIVEDDKEGGETQLFGREGKAEGGPGAAIPAEPTFIFNAELGQLVQISEQSTVIFASGGDGNGERPPGDIPDQGPTVIFDANVAEGAAAAALAIPMVRPAGGEVVGGTAPAMALPPPRPSVVKDILLGVMVALVVILGIVLWRLVATRPESGKSFATLVITANPPRAAEVVIDGKPRGMMSPGTPYTLKDLEPREHRVAIKSLGADPIDRTVVLKPGDVTILEITFSLVSTTGSLTLKVPKGARVLLDGAEVSERSLGSPLEIAAGKSHEVRVEKEGFQPATFSLTLKPGEKAIRQVTLEPAPTSSSSIQELRVRVRPDGAEVFVDGVSRGVSPVSVKDLAPGKHRVKASLAGYKTREESVELVKGKERQVSFVLEKQASAPPSKGTHAAKVLAEPAPKRAPAAAGKKGGERPNAEAKPGRKGGEKPTAERPKEPKGEKVAAKGGGGPEGYLVANTTPWARVFVDGKDTGKTTPIVPRSKIALRPGKHKITFKVEGKEFSFPVVVTAGQITRLIEKLPVQ
jgi:eukaryotic-like serine/threonine-protein kinase